MKQKETPNPSRLRGRGVEVSKTLFYEPESSLNFLRDAGRVIGLFGGALFANYLTF